MKQRALLLSQPLVPRFIARLKTATRRTPGPMNSLVDGKRVSGKKWKELAFDWDTVIVSGKNDGFMVHSRYTGKGHVITPIYQPGDWLWFKETWAPANEHISNWQKLGYLYSADKKDVEDTKWRPSIHMPKDACRLWAEVTTCTCERVQDITEEQAIAEGVDSVVFTEHGQIVRRYKNYSPGCLTFEYENPVDSFKSLWASINGWESWISNPPVYAINYKILSTTGKPLEKENV